MPRHKYKHYSIYPDFTPEQLKVLEAAARARDISLTHLLNQITRVVVNSGEAGITELLKDGGKPPRARTRGQHRFYTASPGRVWGRGAAKAALSPEIAPTGSGEGPRSPPNASGGLIPPDPEWEAQFTRKDSLVTESWIREQGYPDYQEMADERGHIPDSPFDRAANIMRNRNRVKL